MALTKQKVIISGNDLEFYTYPLPIQYGVTIPYTLRRKEKTSRIISERSIYATKAMLRRLLQANTFQYKDLLGEPFQPIFITFTFAEAVTDLTTAQKFFTKFIRVFTNKEFNQNKNFLKYLGVPEIQKKRELTYGVGVWHFHVVFFNLPFIEKIYDKIKNYWGQGFTLVQTIYSTNQLIKYLSKYLTKNNSDERLFAKKNISLPEVYYAPLLFAIPKLLMKLEN